MVNSNITALNSRGKGTIEPEEASVLDEKSKKTYKEHIEYLERSLASLREMMTTWIQELDSAKAALLRANERIEAMVITQKNEVNKIKSEYEKKMNAVEKEFE